MHMQENEMSTIVGNEFQARITPKVIKLLEMLLDLSFWFPNNHINTNDIL